MKIYTLSTSQHLPLSREETWEFISNPAQLENITSRDLSFTPLHPLPKKMYEGMIIHYQIKPFPGIRMQWITEISHMDEGSMFIDEQRFGPFRFWHHEHRIIEKTNGTVLQDLVHYVMPFGVVGRITHRMYIRKMLEKIFAYRKEAIEDLFST